MAEKKYPKFDFEQFPVGYFSDNKKGTFLRKQLIKNELKMSECDIGKLEINFFSKENIDLINKQLILTVYNKTKKQFLICAQKEEDLLVIMRYIFIENARHLPYDIPGQIRELNCNVIGEILPVIISNVDQKIGYLEDISTQPIGPPLPINTKNLERTLPSISNLIHMRETNNDKFVYKNEVLQESNIQGFLGLQGFDYGDNN